MKKKVYKRILAYAAMAASFGYAGLADAHIYSGFIINKSTQVLTLNCPAGTALVRAQVLDSTANKGIMSVTIYKDGNAQTASDLSQGDGVYSDFAVLTAQSGTYYLIPSQTAVTVGQYKIQYHCESSTGAETTLAPATLTQQ